MSHVIIDTASNKIHTYKSGSVAIYNSSRVALAMCTKLNNLHPTSDPTQDDRFCVSDYDAYHAANPVKMVTRINLMTGLPYEEAEDTPVYMSPAYESYWSM